jgi:hypothetical protein
MGQLQWNGRPSQAIDLCYPLRSAPFSDVSSSRSAAIDGNGRQIQFEQLVIPDGEEARERRSALGNTISYTSGIRPRDYVFSSRRNGEEVFAAKRAVRKSKVRQSHISRKRERFTPDSNAEVVKRARNVEALTKLYSLRHHAG